MTHHRPANPLKRTASGQSASFLERQANTLGFRNAFQLAKALGLSYKEVLPLWHGTRGQLIEADLDPVFAALADYVDQHIGAFMSVREELQRKLSADRRERLAQRLRALNR